jgi:hypothetical protein
MDYSIGEFAVYTLNNSNNFLTQGFQQPFKFTWVAVPENIDITSQIAICPNPVINSLNIIIEKPDKGIYRVVIYNLMGQLLSDKSYSAGNIRSENLQFDFSTFATGNYYVSIMHNAVLLRTEKIVKINQ